MIEVIKSTDRKLIKAIASQGKFEAAKALLDKGFNVVEDVAVLKSYIQDDNERTACDLVFDIIEDVNVGLKDVGFYVIRERDKFLTSYFEDYEEADAFWKAEVKKLENERRKHRYEE